MANSKSTRRRLVEQERQFTQNNGGRRGSTSRTIDSDVRSGRSFSFTRRPKVGASDYRRALQAIDTDRSNRNGKPKGKGSSKGKVIGRDIGAVIAAIGGLSSGIGATSVPRGSALAPVYDPGFAPQTSPAAALAGPAAQMPNVEDYVKMLPTVDKAAYVGPYDAAGMQAHAAHQQAVPVINDIYGGLQANLMTGQADYNKQADLNKADLQAALQRSQGAVQGIVNPAIANLEAQGVAPGMAAEVQAQAALGQGEQEAANARALQHQDRIAEVQQQSAAGRGQDAQLAQSASLANAQNNLGQIMGQIGLKRAGAEQQYEQDLSKRAQDEFALRQEFATRQAELEAEAQEAALRGDDEAMERAWKLEDREWELEQRESSRGTEVAKAASAAVDRIRARNESASADRLKAAEYVPADDFWSRFNDISTSDPDNADTLQNILDEVGKERTAANKAKAVRMVRDNAEDIRAAGANPQRILAWLEEVYDTKPRTRTSAKIGAGTSRALDRAGGLIAARR